MRSAFVRLIQVRGVTDGERDVAFKNIEAAADYYRIALKVED